MKYFLPVVGEIANWQPPDEIDSIAFKVDRQNLKISFVMRACCSFEKGTFAAHVLPEHVHQILNAIAVSVIRSRDEVHAEREAAEELGGLREANAVFLAGIGKHLKADK